MQLACGRALALSHSFTRTSPVLPALRALSQAHRLQPCRAASGGDGGSGGDASQQIAPPNVRELARMANIAITDEEVGMRLAMHVCCPSKQCLVCCGKLLHAALGVDSHAVAAACSDTAPG